MEIQELVDWAFERHLNPLSWYIRPVFMILLAYAAYKRSWTGLIITFILLMSSMVWFPAPDKIDPQMYEVLEYEKQLFSHPLSGTLAILALLASVVLGSIVFWKRSLKLGLIVCNVGLIGKLLLSLLFTGTNGWGPLGTILFGLIIVNGIGLYIFLRRKAHKEKDNQSIDG
jgi:nicotinamide riboside transporter PnuC